MAKPDLGGIANRLFEGFLAPLVLGGEMTPGKPIGGRAAITMGRERAIADTQLASLVQLARTRTARKLAALDRVDPPTMAEWALGAALHDLVQSTHPGLRGAFRRGTPGRILALVDATLARVPAPANVGEALARHTWFSRLFEIERTDTVIRWWVGSRTFLGTDPPPRLGAWPELRRVNIERTPRPLMDLPETAVALDDGRFGLALTGFLAKTPLTDLATAHRASPAFEWTAETLGFLGAHTGRTLTTRALALAPANRVDSALGRATRHLLARRDWKAADPALDLLGQRALAEAESIETGDRAPAAGDAVDDAAFARAVGALVARQLMATQSGSFSRHERGRLLAVLEPWAQGPAAREARALLSAAASGPAVPPAPAG